VRVPLLDRSMEAKMSAETSVGCVYCVVYQLRQKEWVPLNLKWVHVYLYRDDRDNTHRFVGWTVEDRSLVLNLNVNGSCDYKEKSPDFHRFIGEGGLNETYGFGFHIGNEELAEAKAFKQMVLAIVSPSLLPSSTSAAKPSVPPRPPVPSPSSTTTAHQVSSSFTTTSSSSSTPSSAAPHVPPRAKSNLKTYKNGEIPLGSLNIYPADSKKEKRGDTGISLPFDVVHTQHITHNASTNQFSGISKDWEAVLNKQFGLPLAQVDTVAVKGYGARIPALLVRLKKYLVKHDGLKSEGIFRLAPSADENAQAKQELENGEFKGASDINVIANLMKVFFRDLPQPLLQSLSKQDIMQTPADDEMLSIVDKLPKPNRSVLMWMCDLFAEVVAETDANRMSHKSLAIVFGPNLYRDTSESSDPMEAFAFLQQVGKFVELISTWREKSTQV
jgi:hypothetical protein